ncbi:hypothetical protein L1887_50285 [Cichorium endivia]|nr:hypothetical protein L1887_50285 [Cichorium endivia]
MVSGDEPVMRMSLGLGWCWTAPPLAGFGSCLEASRPAVRRCARLSRPSAACLFHGKARSGRDSRSSAAVRLSERWKLCATASVEPRCCFAPPRTASALHCSIAVSDPPSVLHLVPAAPTTCGCTLTHHQLHTTAEPEQRQGCCRLVASHACISYALSAAASHHRCPSCIGCIGSPRVWSGSDAAYQPSLSIVGASAASTLGLPTSTAAQASRFGLVRIHLHRTATISFWPAQSITSALARSRHTRSSSRYPFAAAAAAAVVASDSHVRLHCRSAASPSVLVNRIGSCPKRFLRSCPRTTPRRFATRRAPLLAATTTTTTQKTSPKRCSVPATPAITRRVRCNHENPCDNCLRLNISCTWIKASKGKQASGRRIDLLRKGHNPAAATDLVPSPPGARLPAEHAAITNPSPSASRAILPPPGHSHPHPHPHPHAHSPRHYPPPPAGSAAMSPPGVPPSANSPSQMMGGSSLYSRDGPSGSRNSYGGYGRFDGSSAAGPSGTAQQPSPSSHWSSPSARSPAHRYPSHGSYGQSDYPPSHLAASTSSSSHHASHQPYHSPSHSYPSHQSFQNQPPPPHHQRQQSSAAAGASAPASNFGFAPSETFSEGLGGSFSELAPDVAASLRLPDFGTSLADSYLNPHDGGGERRRNVLLDMNSGGLPHDGGSGSAGNGMGGNANGFHQPHNAVWQRLVPRTPDLPRRARSEQPDARRTLLDARLGHLFRERRQRGAPALRLGAHPQHRHLL